MSSSGGHIESDILNIDIFCKYRYRIEACEKISIFRYLKKKNKNKQKSQKKHKTHTQKEKELFQYDFTPLRG